MKPLASLAVGLATWCVWTVPAGAVTLPCPADAAPVINGRSLIVSNGRVFFRTSEAAVAPQTTTRVSVASDGSQATGVSFRMCDRLPGLRCSNDDSCVLGSCIESRCSRDSQIACQFDSDCNAGPCVLSSPPPPPSLSARGRFVAFASDASNLVSDDTNGVGDVFVHDRLTGATERVSVASDSTQGNGGSGSPSISADGRFVAFASDASNLVSGDTNMAGDVFVHDRLTGVTERVSVRSDGTQGNPFEHSGSPSISADGRFVAFASEANLPRNSDVDVIVHDRLTGVTSSASGGTFSFVFADEPSISADGRFVAFSGKLGGVGVFVHDRLTGVTDRGSVASDGTPGNNDSGSASISADGRFVAFSSGASNLVRGDTNDSGDVFVHDRVTGATERVSVASDGTQGDGFSGSPSISADGRFVAFYSAASNLVAGDTNICEVGFIMVPSCPDVFVHDRLTGATERVSVASDGTQGNDFSSSPSISAHGRFVAFDSAASNLVSDDTNGAGDVFVRGGHGLEPGLRALGD